MSDNKLTKAQLIEKAKELKFFKRKGVNEIWARENGHFYYTTPPKFTDGLESFKIKRSDVEGKAPKAAPKAVKAPKAAPKAEQK